MLFTKYIYHNDLISNLFDQLDLDAQQFVLQEVNIILRIVEILGASLCQSHPVCKLSLASARCRSAPVSDCRVCLSSD